MNLPTTVTSWSCLSEPAVFVATHVYIPASVNMIFLMTSEPVMLLAVILSSSATMLAMLRLLCNQ